MYRGDLGVQTLRPHRANINIGSLLVTSGHHAGLHLLQVDVRNLSLVTIEDLSDLLESGTAGLDVEEDDEEEFQEDPDLTIILALVQCSLI
jgi:hypothetical protein